MWCLCFMPSSLTRERPIITQSSQSGLGYELLPSAPQECRGGNTKGDSRLCLAPICCHPAPGFSRGKRGGSSNYICTLLPNSAGAKKWLRPASKKMSPVSSEVNSQPFSSPSSALGVSSPTSSAQRNQRPISHSNHSRGLLTRSYALTISRHSEPVNTLETGRDLVFGWRTDASFYGTSATILEQTRLSVSPSLSFRIALSHPRLKLIRKVPLCLKTVITEYKRRARVCAL